MHHFVCDSLIFYQTHLWLCLDQQYLPNIPKLLTSSPQTPFYCLQTLKLNSLFYNINKHKQLNL